MYNRGTGTPVQLFLLVLFRRSSFRAPTASKAKKSRSGTEQLLFLA
jgi:hypothetical protein